MKSLEAESQASLSENQRRMLARSGKWIYSTRLPMSTMLRQQKPLFKFARHEATGWFYSKKLVWEYEGMNNNRTLALPIQASTHFVVYGKPELEDSDLVEILKLALAADVSKDISSATAVFSS